MILENKTLSLKTEFAFNDQCNHWVGKVLKCLEEKVEEVPDPARGWSPSWKLSGLPEDYKIISNRLRFWSAPPPDLKKQEIDWGLIEIKIIDWLPTICRKASFMDPNEIIDLRGEYVCGFYSRNQDPVLYAFREEKHPSLHEFAGEITLSSDLAKSEGAFCFTLAHEMQHALNQLDAVCPALKDWEGFKANVLGLPNSLLEDLSGYNIFFNHYLDNNLSFIETNEVEFLEKRFGSSIQRWFEEFEIFVNNHPLVK